jgi:hypothetical protein
MLNLDEMELKVDLHPLAETLSVQEGRPGYASGWITERWLTDKLRNVISLHKKDTLK